MVSKLKPECERQVSAVLGRPITESESQDLVASVKNYYLQNRQAHPNMSRDQVVSEAAKQYAQRIQQDAARKAFNAKRQALAIYQNRLTYQSMRTNGDSANQAARGILNRVDKYKVGVEQEAKSRLVDFLEKTSPTFLGLCENKKLITDLVHEIAGDDTGNPVAKSAAKAWIDTVESLRERFNAAGGDIGKLEDWLFPQTHDRYKITNAARRLAGGELKQAGLTIKDTVTHKKYNPNQNRDAWIDFVWDKLDRSKYLDDDLKPLSDDAMRALLSDVFETIRTNGANKENVGKVTAGRGKSKANTRQEHRTLMFKDAQARLDYNEVFGSNPSVMGTMMEHIGSMSRDIALMEMLGPSPTNTYNTLKRMAQIDTDQQTSSTGKIKSADNSLLDAMWKNLSGSANVVESGFIASIGQGARNLQVAGKLGSAFISSFTDVATYFHTARVNRMPFARSAMLLVKSLNPADKSDKRFAARAGIIGDELNSAASRFVEGNIGNGITGKLADLTMRLSLLSQWTDAVRRAQSLNTMATFAEATKHNWADIDGWLRYRLEEFGVSEDVWKALQKCKPEELNGSHFLTINSIKNAASKNGDIDGLNVDKLVSTYLSFVMDDSFMASLQPDLMTRSITNWGKSRGTVAGEFVRSIFLFKSFPIAMFTRHLQRSKDLYRYKLQTDGKAAAVWSRVGYMSSLVVSTTLVAYVANMFKDLINGSDVKDPTTLDAFKRAFTAGGGMGFIGDILVSGMDDYKYGHPALMNMAGPVLSTAMDAYTIFDKYKDNKDIGANVLRIVKGNLPVVNLWYTKQLLNHAVFNQIQEMMNPGYHRRIEQKIRKNQGVGYWWKPTDMLPYRMPEIGTEPRR
nr:MAG TPA: structural protein [Caudoviricetes sp.]